MKDRIEACKRSMGYREQGRVTAHCGLCAQAAQEDEKLRCKAGSFYVRTVSGCNEFEARDKVAIGPSDV